MWNINNESCMLLNVGILKNFDLESSTSTVTIPSLTTFFSDELAKLYQPMIYAGDYPNPTPEGTNPVNILFYFEILMSQ